jgi:hypothetical protein
MKSTALKAGLIISKATLAVFFDDSLGFTSTCCLWYTPQDWLNPYFLNGEIVQSVKAIRLYRGKSHFLGELL